MPNLPLPAGALAAIDELRGMLSGDGYDLVASIVDAGTVDLRVQAGEDACADCLVPKSIMTEIAEARLAGTDVRIRQLLYPGEAA